MAAPPRPPVRLDQGRLQFTRRGLPFRPWGDLYHAVLRASWPAFFGAMMALYIAVNLAFAGAYLAGGDGIGADDPESFIEAFSFSVQTLSTIGYGGLSPTTPWAHAVMFLESFVGLVGVALATGICFAKFSRPRARVTFSAVAAVNTRDGRPCLSFRMANERNSRIVDAHLQVYVLMDEVTEEGEHMRRFHPLRLERDRSPLFMLSWTALHYIDGTSPLSGIHSDNADERFAALVVILTGVDEGFVQNVHAQHFYVPEDLRFGARFVDVIDNRDGVITIHHDRLHHTVPEGPGGVTNATRREPSHEHRSRRDPVD